MLTIARFPLSIGYKGTLEVKGEAVIRLSVLAEYNQTAAEPLKNARNAAAGAVRNLDPAVTAARKPEILFYDVNYMSEPVALLAGGGGRLSEEQGFKTFAIPPLHDPAGGERRHRRRSTSRRKSIDVLTDGAVVKVNDFAARERLGYTDKFPRWAIAFKFEAEEAETAVREVRWQVGRTGKLTPLAVVDPVELAGATVRRATLNNLGDIRRKDVRIGSQGAHPPQQRGHSRDPRRRGRGGRARRSSPPAVCPYCGTPLSRRAPTSSAPTAPAARASRRSSPTSRARTRWTSTAFRR